MAGAKEMQFSQLVKNDDVSIRDYRISKTSLIPPMAILNIVYYLLGENGTDMKKIEFKNLEFVRPVRVEDEYHLMFAVNLIKQDSFVSMCCTVQKLDLDEQIVGEPVEVLRGKVVPGNDASVRVIDIKTLRYNALDLIDMDEVYSKSRNVGIVHYDHLRGLGTIYEGKNYVIAQVHFDESYSDRPPYYHIHPAYLDSASVLMYRFIEDEELTNPYILSSIGSVKIISSINRICNVQIEASSVKRVSNDSIISDIELFDGAGKLVGILNKVKLDRISTEDYLGAYFVKQSDYEDDALVEEDIRVISEDTKAPKDVYSDTDYELDYDEKEEVVVEMHSETEDYETEDLVEEEELEDSVTKMEKEDEDGEIEFEGMPFGVTKFGKDDEFEYVDEGDSFQEDMEDIEDMEEIEDVPENMEEDIEEDIKEEIEDLREDDDDENIETSYSKKVPTRAFHYSWEDSELVDVDYAGIPHGIVFFGNDNEVFELVKRKINGHKGQRVVFVKPGKSFELLEEDVYSILLTESDDYRKLAQDLREKGFEALNIVHWWSPDNGMDTLKIKESLNLSFDSVTNIYHQFIKSMEGNRINVLYMYNTNGNEINPMYAGMEGYFRSISIERPEIQYKVIAIEKNYENAEEKDSNAQIIINELKGMDQTGRNVRYSLNGNRAIRCIKDVENLADKAEWRKENGIYLLRNGLTLMGLKFARFLATHGKCKLILVGAPPEDLDVSSYIKEIEKMGSEVIKVNGDFSNRYFIIDLISRIKIKFGEVDGVINISGVTEGLKKDEKDVESVKDYVAQKIHEMFHLDGALSEAELDFILQFSLLAGDKNLVDNYEHYYLESFYHYFTKNVVLSRSHKDVFHICWNRFDDGLGVEDERLAEEVDEAIFNEENERTPIFNYLVGQEHRDLVLMRRTRQPKDWSFWENTFECKEPLDLLPWEEIELIQEDKDEFQNDGLESIEGLDDDYTQSAEEFDFSEDGVIDTTNIDGIQIGVGDMYGDDYEMENKLTDEQIALDSEYDVEGSIDSEDDGSYGLVGGYDEDEEEYSDYKEVHEYDQVSLGSEENDEYEYLDEGSEDTDSEDNNEYTESEVVSLDDHREKVSDKSLKPEEMVDEKISHEPVAIIGMSGVLPSSKDILTFWSKVQDGAEFINEVPKEKWNWEAYYGDPTKERNKTYAKWGGFIPGSDKFDAEFFNIDEKEADLMDPQQRIMLESVWRAVEDAGYRANDFKLSDTGVFVGIMNSDYQDLIAKNNVEPGVSLITGLNPGFYAHRVSSLLKLKGPSETINTSTASSSVAICRAVDELSSGRCGVAIVTGVNLLFNPTTSVLLDKAGLLSKDKNIKPFDKSANGYVRSECAGTLILKPLSKAKEDGDNIYTVIRGTAMNHGVSQDGLLSADVSAIEEVVYNAWERSGVDPLTVGYIEAEGMANIQRDAAEFLGTRKAFEKLFVKWEKEDAIDPFIRVGTVKTKIGHTEAASGIAGILNVIMSMKNNKLPDNRGFVELNSSIELDNCPFVFDGLQTSWENKFNEDGNKIPKRAGVSNFGISGVNTHIVLEEYMDNHEYDVVDAPQLFVFSAKNEDRLKDYAEKFIEFIDGEEKQRKLNFADVAYTLQVGREPMDERLAIIAKSFDELKERLQKFCNGKTEEKFMYSGNIKQNVKNLEMIFMGQEAGIFVELLMKNHSYENLAQLWILGIDLDWNPLHAERNPRRLPLPTYQFHGEFYWYSRNTGGNTKSSAQKSALFEEETTQESDSDFTVTNDIFADLSTKDENEQFFEFRQ